MAAKRPGRVFVLQLFPPDQPSMFEDEAQEILGKLTAGSSVTRYSREWIVGRTTREADVLSGRIGFRGVEGVAEVWDEERKDFFEVAHPAGLTAPFAIDLVRLRLVVQPRGSEMKLTGIIGAMQALLSTPERRWRIQNARRTGTLAEWRATVDRITSVRFRVRRPNPNWRGTPDLEHLMTESDAEVATLELQSDTGVDADAEFVAQSQAHVDRGYGEAVYKGVREEGSEVRETVFNTALGAEEEAIEVPVNTETGEAEHDALTEALSQEPPVGDTDNDEQ